MKSRTLYYEILPQLHHKNAIVITGMRQVGKTTLMKQLAAAWKQKQIWFDFDNPLDTMPFETPDYDAIYENLRNELNAAPNERFLVCIDEIQNHPDITRIVKYLIDHYALKFIITGSSNYYLRNLFPESLSGRKFLYVLHPLNFREYLHFRDIAPQEIVKPNAWEDCTTQNKRESISRSSHYADYISFGGFPEVVLATDRNTKTLVLKNIFSSFFEKDIKVFSELRDVKELRDLILLLAPRNGNMLDVTRLAGELGINRVKTYSYLEFLEGTFFLKLISKYSKSIDRKVAGGKKVYFSDTGILKLLGDTTEGQLLETAVANQLSQYGELTFFNKRNQAEIDFILNKEVAIEVKQRALPADIKKLNTLAESLDIPRRYVITNTYTDLEQAGHPWYW